MSIPIDVESARLARESERFALYVARGADSDEVCLIALDRPRSERVDRPVVVGFACGDARRLREGGAIGLVAVAGPEGQDRSPVQQVAALVADDVEDVRTEFGRTEPVNNVVVFGDLIAPGVEVIVVGPQGERRLSQEELFEGMATGGD